MNELEKRLIMINRELNRLGLSHLYPTVCRIVTNFRGFPLDLEVEPAQQLLGLLINLDPPTPAYQVYLLISKLDAFSYRAFVVPGEQREPIYWQPLEIPYCEFFPGRKKVVVQSECEYPASDIIIHFCESLVEKENQ